MNWSHFKTVLWLRWRLRSNQFKRGGPLNAAIFFIIIVGAGLGMVAMFGGGLALGLLVLPEAPPDVQMFVWDGLMVAALFSWTIGMLTDLQRTESLSLERFMHLPVSLRNVFVINYASSIITLTLCLFVPGCVGLLLGQAFSQPQMLLALPVLGAFVFALTALTYQFQGWLALLMANPRRRRTVIVVVTMSFVVLAQTPQLLNVYQPWKSDAPISEKKQQRLQELTIDFAAGKLKEPEYRKAVQDVEADWLKQTVADNERHREALYHTGYLVNLCVPPAWLAVSVRGLASGNALPALLTTLGFVLIGMLSMQRAYRTTLKIYTGTATAKGTKARPTISNPTKKLMVERRLPWLSEHASAVAMAGFRGLSRAPEVKMLMIGPLMMLLMLGFVFGPRVGKIPSELGPLGAFSAAAMTVLITVQLIANQFGYDRTGFRAYVLCPTPRREILLGKNLAIAPFTLGMALLALVIALVVMPIRIDLMLATLLQIVGLYLVSCLCMNVLSIYAPIPIAMGSMRPAQVKWGPVLLQMCFMMVYPIILVPLMLPYGLELLLIEFADMPRGIPVTLVFTVFLFVGIVLLYRKIITRQGGMLQAREQKILEVVTSREE